MSLRGLRSKPWQSASLCAGFLLKTLQRRTDCRVGLRPPRNDKNWRSSLYFTLTGKRGRLRAPPAADEASKKEGQRSEFEAAVNAAHKLGYWRITYRSKDTAMLLPPSGREVARRSRDGGRERRKCCDFSELVRNSKFLSLPQSASLTAPSSEGAKAVRLDHREALTCHRHVIHYCGAASLPSSEGADRVCSSHKGHFGNTGLFWTV